jgi:hypothetical protein
VSSFLLGLRDYFIVTSMDGRGRQKSKGGNFMLPGIFCTSLFDVKHKDLE